MTKEKIAKAFPAAYEFYKLLQLKQDIGKIRRQNELFSKLTEEQILQNDKALYEKWQGRSLDWDNLESYTEKMQWYKIYACNQEFADLADKIKVRKWVEDRIGNGYLIPQIGCWDCYDDICFDELPKSFVLQTNHGSSNVIIVKDKQQLPLSFKMRMKRQFTLELEKNYSTYAYEMHYQYIHPKILAEKYIASDDDSCLKDFKFLCFEGKPYYCWVDVDRFENHKRNVYDLDWNLQGWNQNDYGNSKYPIERPKEFEEMIEVARELSKGFSHVRVDLYNSNGKVYFGEMTFTSCSGLEPIYPYEADLMLGRLWQIDTSKKTF